MEAENTNDNNNDPSSRDAMPPPAPDKDPKGDPIDLRVVAQDGSEVFFRIRSNTPLDRLMDSYCDRQSISRAAVRFMFDGERINSGMTPATLDMEDNDVIDAMLQQYGHRLFISYCHRIMTAALTQLWLPHVDIPDAWDNIHITRIKHFIGDEKRTLTAHFVFTLDLDEVDAFYHAHSTLILHRTDLDRQQTQMLRLRQFVKPRPAYCDHGMLRQSRVGRRTLDRLREGSLIYYNIEVPIPPPSAAVNEEWRLGIQLKNKRWLVESDTLQVCWRPKVYFRF